MSANFDIDCLIQVDQPKHKILNINMVWNIYGSRLKES